MATSHSGGVTVHVLIRVDQLECGPSGPGRINRKKLNAWHCTPCSDSLISEFKKIYILP